MSTIATKRGSRGYSTRTPPKEGDITFLFDPGFFTEKNHSPDKKVFYKAKNSEAEGREFDRIIEGYANVKVVDRIGDFIRPKAFEHSLDTYMINPQLRFNHEEGSSIGMVTEAEVREDGLWIQAAIGDWDLANEKWKQIEFGSLKALSIMGRTLEWEEKEVDGPDGKELIWDITKFELIENSVVEIPMNQLSLFSKKGFSKQKALDMLLHDVAKRLKQEYLERQLSKAAKRLKTMTGTEEQTESGQEAEFVEAEVEETFKAEDGQEEEVEETEESTEEEESEGSDMEKNVEIILELLENDLPELKSKVNALEERVSSIEENGTDEPKRYKKSQKVKISKSSITNAISGHVDGIVEKSVEKAFEGINLDEIVEKKVERLLTLSEKILYKREPGYGSTGSGGSVEDGLKNYVAKQKAAQLGGK